MDERDRMEKKLGVAMLNMESLEQWVLIEHEGDNLSKLISEMGYHKIGIFGYGVLGRLLYRLLDRDLVEVKCIIDRSFQKNGSFQMTLDSDLPEVDVIIITSAFYYEEIRREIERKGVRADIRLLDEFLFQL